MTPRPAHAVRLPHPDAVEPTVASCVCGSWSTTYRWGEHDAAAAAAAEHVGDSTLTQTIETRQCDGSRRVLAGRSR